MPELSLGIGRMRQAQASLTPGIYEGWTREWLYWYDQNSNKYPTPEEVAQQQRERAEEAEQQLELLVTRLREKGIDPDNL